MYSISTPLNIPSCGTLLITWPLLVFQREHMFEDLKLISTGVGCYLNYAKMC